MSKKGISNLISAALLIVFIVSLGLIVTNWGQKLVGGGIEKSRVKIGTDLECQDVSVKIEEGRNDREVVIKNNKALKGFITRFITVKDNAYVDYANKERGLEKFDAWVFNLEGDKKDGQGNTFSIADKVKEIEIIPRVDIGKQVVDCENKRGKYVFSSPIDV